jgi:hypothetical protein
MTSSQPLTVPGDLLYRHGFHEQPNREKQVAVTDFEFLDDSLLMVTEEEAAIIIVSGLGMAYSHKTHQGLDPLKYSMAKGYSAI